MKHIRTILGSIPQTKGLFYQQQQRLSLGSLPFFLHETVNKNILLNDEM